MSIADLDSHKCMRFTEVPLYKNLSSQWNCTGPNQLSLSPGYLVLGKVETPNDNITQHLGKSLQVLGSLHFLWPKSATDEKPSQDLQTWEDHALP